jgi:hypothetical protein
VALCLVRRRQQAARWWPLALAPAAAGMLHWFTLPVLAGLAAAAVVARSRRGLADASAVALGALPAVALVVVQATGRCDGAPLANQAGISSPVRALVDSSSGAWWLSAALVVAFVVGVVRSHDRALHLGWSPSRWCSSPFSTCCD